MRSEKNLRHLPFFVELSGLRESDDAWRAATAGLVVLRLVDSWIENGPAAVAADAWGPKAVRSAIDEIGPHTPIRSILSGIVQAMTESKTVDIARIGPRLMAYARSLDFEGKWQLAIDVYQTVLAHVHPVREPDLAIDANLRLGYCGRMAGDWTLAAAGYGQAGQISERSGDLMGVLRSRIGVAKLALVRGNMPRAEEMLDDAIDCATKHGFTELRSAALHDRSVVAHARGDYERAIRLAYGALEETSVPSKRDRVLADIAASFLDLGVRSAARDAYMVLAATAEEQYSRWSSTLNLLEIAALDRCEPVFEQYRRELDAAALTPELRAKFFLEIGKGQDIFGEPDAARESFERAIETAGTHNLHQLVFQAEACLEKLRQGVRRASAEAAFEPEAVAGIADALRGMRAKVGMAG